MKLLELTASVVCDLNKVGPLLGLWDGPSGLQLNEKYLKVSILGSIYHSALLTGLNHIKSGPWCNAHLFGRPRWHAHIWESALQQ